MEQMCFDAIPAVAAPVEVRVGQFPITRSWFGFFQSQDAPGKPWRFNVTGFDGTTDTDGICSVRLVDGSEKDVPIDGENFITIRGKKYGPLEWDH